VRVVNGFGKMRSWRDPGLISRHSQWLAGVSNVCLQFLKQSAVLSLLLLRPLRRRGLSRPVAGLKSKHFQKAKQVEIADGS
jgi:hypothetical protein